MTTPDIADAWGTLATVANMKRYYDEDPSTLAYSPETGEEYSANPADYWHLNDDEVLRDGQGEPMVLVRRHVLFLDVADGTER